jgi:hypothetical protein
MAFPRRSAAVLILGSALLAACPDLGGFSGGGDPSDGGSPAADATSGADASPSPDATTDAPADGGATDAAPDGSFCATHPGDHVVCADYDTDAGTGWDPRDLHGAVASLDQAIYATPPHSLSIVVPATATADAWVFESRKIPVTTKAVHVEADIRACDASGGVGAVNDYFTINHYDNANHYGTVDVGVEPVDGGGSHTYVNVRHDGTSDVVYDAGAALPTDHFAHIAIDITLDKINGSVKLSVDGVVRADLPGIVVDSLTVKSRTVAVGAYNYHTTNSCVAYIDDVIVDITQ